MYRHKRFYVSTDISMDYDRFSSSLLRMLVAYRDHTVSIKYSHLQDGKRATTVPHAEIHRFLFNLRRF